MSGVAIGLHGLPGSGKDTIADYLVANYGFVRIAFADLLKREIMQAFFVNDSVFSRENKEKPIWQLNLTYCREPEFVEWVESNYGKENPAVLYHTCTPRWIMQRWGDWRRSENPNHFVNHVESEIFKTLTFHNVVITDVRYVNEADMLTSKVPFWHRSYMSLILEVQRPDNPFYRNNGHSSNERLSDRLIDRTISNEGSVEDLHSSVIEALKYFSVAY